MEAKLSKADTDDVKDRLVAALLEKNRIDLETFSPAQVCGILNISPKTLGEIKDLPRIDIIPRKVVAYRAQDLREWMEKRRTCRV